MSYRSIRGMEDILPQDAGVWQELERRSRAELESYGYQEIRTPMLEETAVFVRSIGETTDIVTKEMYTFSDRKERSLTLRPEGTAPIVRSYIEHSLDKVSPELRLYYIGPMFRAERPQKGRSRQFHQVGVEAIGSRSPQVDAEVVMRLNGLLRAFGLEGFVIKLNSLGCKKDKAAFAEKLKAYLESEKNRLCDDCKTRIDKNVLRVLDCKNESCIQLVRNAPNVIDSLCPDCAGHFSKVSAILETLKIDVKVTKNLVRGLDYYTGTVFEVTHPALGGQDAIAAGGRYDNLVKDMGGPDVGAIGFALGIERVILALGDKKGSFSRPAVIYIATLGEQAKTEALKLAEELRTKLNDLHKVNVVTLIDLKESSLKSQMRSADKNGAKAVVIMGEDELKQGKLAIKDMAQGGEQILIDRAAVIEEIKKRIC